VESEGEKDRNDVCNEGNAEGEDHQEEVSAFSYERKVAALTTEPSLSSEYGICLPGHRQPVLGDGLRQRWRFKVSYG
jgi:hypothetical protein